MIKREFLYLKLKKQKKHEINDHFILNYFNKWRGIEERFGLSYLKKFM